MYGVGVVVFVGYLVGCGVIGEFVVVCFVVVMLFY